MDFVIKEELHFVHCESEANIKTEIDNDIKTEIDNNIKTEIDNNLKTEIDVNIKTESYSDNEDLSATTTCEFIKIELDPNEMEPNLNNDDELPDPESIYHSMIGAFSPNITDGVPSPTTASVRRCQVCENPAKGHPKPRGKYCQQLPARDAEKYKLLKLIKHRDRQKTEKAKAKCRERQSTEAAKARCRKRQSTEEAKARCRKRQSTEEAKARCRERHRTEEAKVNCQERKRNQTEEAKAKDRERHRTEKAKSKCQERNQTGEDKDVPKEECRDTQQEEVVGVPQIPISETFLALNPQIYRKILPKPPSTEFS